MNTARKVARTAHGQARIAANPRVFGWRSRCIPYSLVAGIEHLLKRLQSGRGSLALGGSARLGCVRHANVGDHAVVSAAVRIEGCALHQMSQCGSAYAASNQVDVSVSDGARVMCSAIFTSSAFHIEPARWASRAP
jgi:hypothetical protein